MIRSMTGYGKGSSEAADLRIIVELKSLNNRFADLRMRLPSELQAEEIEIRRRILARVRRGRVELSLDLERADATALGFTLNRPLLQAVTAAARAAREEFGLSGDLDVNAVLSLPDVLQRSPFAAGLGEKDREAIHRAVDEALLALDAARCREGQALREEILSRMERMTELVADIRRLAAEFPENAHRKLTLRIEALLSALPVDPARLAQEAAFLADRCDVTEEMVRLEGHLEQGRDLLAEPDGEPVGKRLDFLLQEIHRETNTINSKSGDLEISRRALALKSEAEKVREQVQNLE